MLYSVLKNNSPTQSVILINAFFLTALLLLGKADPMAIVFAYVFETVIIGFFHFIKLFIIVLKNETSKYGSKLMDYFSVFFFLAHFGGFVAIQSLLIYTAFAIKDNRFSTSLNISNFTDLVYLNGFKVIIGSIVISNLATLFISFIKEKKYQHASLETYMIKPYLRIFIQQFLAIVPLLFLYFTDQVGVGVAILLVGLRAFMDLYFNFLVQKPERIKYWALKFSNKNKPQEFPEIEASLKAFFEE